MDAINSLIAAMSQEGQHQAEQEKRLHTIELNELEIEWLLTHLARSLEMSARPYGDSVDVGIEQKLRDAFDPGDQRITAREP